MNSQDKHSLHNRHFMTQPSEVKYAASCAKHKMIDSSPHLTLCTDFALVSYFAKRLRSPRVAHNTPVMQAKIRMANSWNSCPLHVRTHETISRSAALWLGKKTQTFSGTFPSEARMATTVWNWSGRALSPGALHPVLCFSLPPLHVPVSAPGSPRMEWIISGKHALRLPKKMGRQTAPWYSIQTYIEKPD